MDKTYLKTKKATINYNADVHNIMAQKYDDLHVEIFNPTEQARIEDTIKRAFSNIATGAKNIKLLDFGAGTGNLTIHLWRLGAEVVAADVSEESLKRIKEKIGDSNRLDSIVLNGEDLSNISDNAFDMVATYSVLHHIPDYLAIIEELVRVVKPGGIIYLDHEVSPSYWNPDEVYNAYLRELGEKFLNTHLYELGMAPPRVKGFRALTSYTRIFLDLFGGREQSDEPSDYGDIHVFRHDHIEWGEITARLALYCDLVAEADYLVCRERSENPLIWKKWQGKCRDMRYMIARKKAT